MLLRDDAAGNANRQKQPEAGRRFGPYEVLAPLGGGGMGLVYRAWDERLHREVAIKVLHDTYQPPGFRQRFLIEARAASALNHPHICTIFDIGEQDGDPYLVMELIEGMTLKERIRLGAPPVEEIVRYAMEMADALSSAHAKHIIHRDIKPDNVFLQRRPDGGHQVKVLDFGLAKIHDEGSGARMARPLDITGVGLTVGTLAYMSPEQARGEPLDARSDLFSLGVVMYEMATRRVPFPGENSAMMLVELLRHEPEPLRNWNDAVPRSLEKLVMRLLAKDRASRYQSAVEVRETLRKLDLKSGGGGRRRSKQAIVPLVQAPDPVARMPHLPARPKPAEVTASTKLPQLQAGPPGGKADAAAAVSLPAPAPHNNATASAATRHKSADRAAEWIPPRRDQGIRESGSRDIAVRPSGEQAARAVDLSVTAYDPVGQHKTSREKLATEDTKPTPEAQPAAQPVPPAIQAREAAASVEPENTTRAKSSDVGPRGSSAHALAAGRAAPQPAGWSPWQRVGAALLLVAVLATICVLLRRSGFHPGEALVGSNTPILLTPAANRTGESSLDGVAAAAMELELQQSRVLRLRGLDAFFAGRERVRYEDHAPAEVVTVRRVAEALKTRAYVYGELRKTGSGYVFSAQLLDTRSNDRRTSAEANAKTRAEIPAAVEDAVRRLRSSLGETTEQIAETNRPLSGEGSRDLEALQAFAEAHEAAVAGRAGEATHKLEDATERDPTFVQAQMELAWRYAENGDETAAAERARLAAQAAGKAGEPTRLLAASADALLRLHHPDQALESLRRYQEIAPGNAAGPAAVARVRRWEWRTTEDLLAAQQAVAKDPYDTLANRELLLAYLTLDRIKDAQQTFDDARRAGVVVDPAAVLLMRFMQAGGPAQWSVQKGGRPDSAQPGAGAMRALLLDNTAQFTAGASLWRELAMEAGKNSSVAALLLSRAALDRALAGQCGSAREFLAEQPLPGPNTDASFRAALASTLCGDTARAAAELVREKNPGVTLGSEAATNGALLDAAMALAQRDGTRAEAALRPIQQRGESPVAIYLRALSHLAEHRPDAAAADLEAVAARRGCALLTETEVYPVALEKLAQVYAAQGEKARSEATRRRLAESGWMAPAQ